MVAVALTEVVSRQADFHDTVNVAGNTVSIHRPPRCEVDVCANVVESKHKAGRSLRLLGRTLRAHIGTYALADRVDEGAHIAGYALPDFLSRLAQREQNSGSRTVKTFAVSSR